MSNSSTFTQCLLMARTHSALLCFFCLFIRSSLTPRSAYFIFLGSVCLVSHGPETPFLSLGGCKRPPSLGALLHCFQSSQFSIHLASLLVLSLPCSLLQNIHIHQDGTSTILMPLCWIPVHDVSDGVLLVTVNSPGCNLLAHSWHSLIQGLFWSHAHSC